MHASIRYCLYWLLCLISVQATAQTGADTSLYLKEVTINSTRLNSFSAGYKVQTIDSNVLSQYRTLTLSSLLEDESSLYIKSYGMGSLAVSSFRGGNAQHTAVLWNGFNLNNPMYGQFDLALMPLSFVNSVSIQFGGGSALWGSGAVGGAILLNNESSFNRGVSIMAGVAIGSYGSLKQNISAGISGKKFSFSVSGFNQTANNDFTFHNSRLRGNPEQKQTHAGLKERGLLTEAGWQLNPKQLLNVLFWYQNSDRDIPPTMLQTVSKSFQKDESYRLLTQWKHTGGKTTYMVRGAWINEKLIFNDTVSNLYSNSRSNVITGEAEARYQLAQGHLVGGGINNTYTRAVSDGYSVAHEREALAFFASYSFISVNRKLRATTSARQEMIKGRRVPFTFSAGAEYSLLQWLTVKGNFSRLYRLPTFNDLYWSPGGNPELQPEKGYGGEAGFVADRKISKLNIRFEATIFTRSLDNWIVWTPLSTYWSPQNILKVWSRGAETNTELSYSAGKVNFRLGVLTSYVISTNEKARAENDASVGKQLIYVPMYSGRAKFSVGYKKLLLTYTQTYSGYRFTSDDNTQYLKPYTVANIYAAYGVNIKNYGLRFFVAVSNLLNGQYQVILNRAIPLRNYEAGIFFQFSKPNKNQI